MFNLSTWLIYNNSSKRCFKLIKNLCYLSHNTSSHVESNQYLPVSFSCNNLQHTVIAKGDSAATGHYFTMNDACVLKDIKKERGPSVILPDNDVIGSTHGAQLPTPTPLPQAATKTAILPRLTSSSLVSLPQLCDHGCQVLLTDTDLHVIKNGKFVLF